MEELLNFAKKSGCKIKKWQNYGFGILFPISIDKSLMLDVTVRVFKELWGEDILFNTITTKGGDYQNGTQEEEKALLIFFKKAILKAANEISQPFELTAEFLGGIFTVGVGGDEGTFMPIINLVGLFPGHEALGLVANRICNNLPINRVSFEIKTTKTTE